MVNEKSKEASTAKDGSLKKEDTIGPKAFLTTIIQKVKPKSFAKSQAAEADSASAFTQVLRKEGGPGSGRKPEEEKSYGKIVVKDEPKPAGYGKIIFKGQKQSVSFDNKSYKFLESVSADVNGVDGTPKNEMIGFTKFKVVLLQEGMGNFQTAYWYSKNALETAVPVFEGAKIYANHPSLIDEQTRPERDVKDILGHFENVHIEENEDGRHELVGEVNILADDSYRWARSLMEHAVEFSKKYPDKEFIGLSINADGDANEIAIDDLVSAGVPKSTLPKLQKAKENGISTIKVVTVITDAVSCDLVTQAGAGGKVTQLLETDRGENSMDNVENKDQQDPTKPEQEATSAPAPAHDDAAQDAELIKKMIKKHLGDDVDASEEECGVVKEAYEAHKEMGCAEDEAEKKAVDHLKLAKHVASKKEAAAKEAEAKEAEAHKEAEAKKEAEAAKENEKHKESFIALKAENAKLKESLRKIEVQNHIETLCAKSKLPNNITKSFKEAAGSPKTIEEVNQAWKLFEAGLKRAEVELGGFSGMELILPEKQKLTESKKFNFDGILKD